MSDPETPKGKFKRPWINPAHTWTTQEELAAYVREMNEHREEYVELHRHLDAADQNVRRTFRMVLGRPRQGEIRKVLERKRRRRERLDPITWVDNEVTWVVNDAAYMMGIAPGAGIVRTFITPRGMYHLSVYGPLQQRGG